MPKEKRKFKQIMRKFDISKFQPLTGSLEHRVEIMYWNLWNQFGLTPELVREQAEKGERPDITDYAWTDGAKKQFYECEAHAKLWKKLNARRYAMLKGELVLNMEPCDINDEEEPE